MNFAPTINTNQTDNISSHVKIIDLISRSCNNQNIWNYYILDNISMSQHSLAHTKKPYISSCDIFCHYHDSLYPMLIKATTLDKIAIATGFETTGIKKDFWIPLYNSCNNQSNVYGIIILDFNRGKNNESIFAISINNFKNMFYNVHKNFIKPEDIISYNGIQFHAVKEILNNNEVQYGWNNSLRLVDMKSMLGTLFF